MEEQGLGMPPDQAPPEDPEERKQRQWREARDALAARRPPNNQDTFDATKFYQYDRKVGVAAAMQQQLYH
jgi:hypothetical protein